jgi:type VI protein secretion system component VasF
VSSSTTERHVFTWMSLALLGLALSVIGWGTEYKLSLYRPSDDTSRLMPQAKLLSKDEQNSPTDKTLISKIKDTTEQKEMRTSLTLLFLAYLVSVAVLFQGFALRLGARGKSRHWHLRQLDSLTFFFALPPPVLS